MNIVSVVDIEPTNESAQDSSATVTFQVDRGRVTNPERLTVFKEEYVFETQTEQWVQVETTVTETTEQHVTLTADVSSFSLFAVTELDEQIDTNGLNQSETNQSETNETETPASTDDGIPGFGAVVAVIAVLAAATVARQRVN
jgi:PGF-CTERM protein